MKKFLKNFNPFILLILALFTLLYFTQDENDKSLNKHKAIKRVVSLSPSITRQLIDLDSEDILVGVTSYHPPLTRKIRIIGSKDLPNIEVILSQNPDIVLTSMEDSSTQNIERLEYTGIRTHRFNWNDSMEAIFANYVDLSKIIDKEDLAQQKIKKYRALVKRYRTSSKSSKIAFFAGHDPLVAVSNKSFIGRAIEDAGGKNVFGDLSIPYPKISVEFLIVLNPDIIISYHSDAEEYFNRILKDFDYMSVIRFQNIYSVTADKICFYDPKDYVDSIIIISDIIREAGKRKNEE